MVTEKVEEEARRLVEGPRQDYYDPPEVNFKRIAGAWSEYTGVKLSSYDVANMLSLMKIMRGAGKGYQHDSVVDCIGYQICISKIKESEDASS